ncbi:MAG: TonB-dependent receptor, partial [Bacteroidota bacterium]
TALDTRYPDGGSTMRTLSAYLSARFDLTPEKLVATAGVRLNSTQLEARFQDKTFFPFLNDEIVQDYLAPSGSAGLIWTPDKRWRFAMVAATGFRAPNVDDVAKVFDSQPGAVIVPNPDVTAEYTYNGEISASRAFGKWLHLGATGWFTYYDNALVVRSATFNGLDSIPFEGELSRVTTMVNARQALLRGFNFNLKVVMARGLSLRHTMTRVWGNDISTTDSIVPMDHIPPLYGRTGLHYERKRLIAELFSLYNGWKRIEDYNLDGEDKEEFATSDGLPAWWTLNAKLTYAVDERLRVQIGLGNILDVHYRTFSSGISGAGRNLMLAIRVGW